MPAGEIPLLGAGRERGRALAEGPGDAPVVTGVAEALAVADDVQVRLFGKPDARPGPPHGRRARRRR